MKDQSLRVLMVEDSEDDALLIIRELKKGGCNPLYERVEIPTAMKKALQEKQWDIILCDYKMPKFSGPSAIAVLKEANIDIPIIIVSGTIGEETSIESMRLGAHDYIMKSNLSRLCPAIARELEDAKIRNRQKQAESQREATLEELRESETKLQAIFDKVGMGIFIIDRDTQIITEANQAAVEMTGLSKERIIGQICNSLVCPALTGKCPVKDLGQSIHQSERKLLHADGHQIDILKTVYLITINGRNCYLESFIDITDRKRADDALRESEEKYRLIFEHSPLGLLSFNEKGVIVACNDNFVKIIGSSREKLTGLNMLNLPDKNMVSTIRKALQGSPGFYEGDYSSVTARKITPVRCLFTPMDVGGGQILGGVGIIEDITERKLVEELLRHSEEKYRSILETIQEGYYEVDLAGNLTFFNDSLFRILGYSKEELIGMNYQQYEDKESLKEVFQTYNKVYNTGGPIKGFGRQIIRKDGTKRYVEVSVSLQKDSSGKPIGFRGISRDITERKQMEDMISQSEERYRTILDEMDNGYFEVDLAGNYTFINNAICRQLGYSKEEMLGLNFRVPMVKESIDIVYNAFKNIYITGKPLRGIYYKARRKDGTTGSAEISGFPLKNKKGETIGFRGMALDITERKQAEDALRESEEKYRTILEDMDDVYFEVDIKGNITFVNASSCKMSGYSEEELLGMPFKKISVPDGIEKVMQYFGEIFLTDKTGKPFLWNLVKMNGEQGFFEIVTSLIKNKNGKPIGFRGIGRDVTERKRAEEVLQQTLASLRNAFGTTIQVMVSAVEMRDPYTAGHQLRVADIARSIAREMGLPNDKIDGIRLAGSIHDIGKLSVPAEILSKPTKLTDLEFSLIKEHPQIGYEMLKDVESQWPLAQIVYQHHERMNGSGYPRNLKGDEILIEARIMAVADVVEAMASHRPYRPGLGIEPALEEIEKNKGIVYDNAVADACLRLFREKNYKIP